jgi:glycosyltransferase involved in cell wall biosynthesis
MPVFNSREDWFLEAIGSLLAQDVSDFEVVISDNGSNAASERLYREAVRRDPRIRYLRHDSPMSAGDNFKFVAEQARGEFFCWTADDDVRAPSFLRRTLALLESDRRAALATCRTVYIDEQGKRVGVVPVNPAMGDASVRRRVAALATPAFYMDIYGLYRLSALRRVRDLRWNAWGMDHVLVFKMLLEGPVPRVQQELFSYRLRRVDRAASLAAFLIQQGAADDDARLDWEKERSRDLLNALWHSDLNLPDKLACLPRVAAILRQESYVVERINWNRHRFNRALSQHDYWTAARSALAFGTLSPGALLRPSAWRFALTNWQRRRQESR